MVYLLVVLHLKVDCGQVTSECDLCGVETNCCLVVTNCLRGTGTFLRLKCFIFLHKDSCLQFTLVKFLLL